MVDAESEKMSTSVTIASQGVRTDSAEISLKVTPVGSNGRLSKHSIIDRPALPSQIRSIFVTVVSDGHGIGISLPKLILTNFEPFPLIHDY